MASQLLALSLIFNINLFISNVYIQPYGYDRPAPPSTLCSAPQIIKPVVFSPILRRRDSTWSLDFHFYRNSNDTCYRPEHHRNLNQNIYLRQLSPAWQPLNSLLDFPLHRNNNNRRWPFSLVP